MNSWKIIYTKYWDIHCVEHWEDLFTQILGNIFCLTLWEDLFTQNTRKYILFNTVGRFIYTKYWEILYVEHCGKIYLHKILGNTLC
jgi:hypothetical protein